MENRPTGFGLARRLAVAAFAFLAAAACSSCHVVARLTGSAKPWIFVANFGDDTVSVVDGDLDREVKTIAVGKSPQSLALRKNPPLVAVANSADRTVTLIDPAARESIAGTVPVGIGPEHVAFSPDGKTLFVTSYHEQTVSIIDVASRSLRGAPVAFAKRPRRIIPSPDGRRLYLLLHDEQGAVGTLDLASGSPGPSAPVGPFPTGLVLSPDGRRLYAGSFDAQNVTVIDTASMAVVETLRVPVGNNLVLHPTRPVLYSFLSFEGEALAFDLERRERVASVEVGDWPCAGAITRDGRFLYVVNEDSASLVKLDTASNIVAAKIAVGRNPNDAVIFASGG